MLEDPRKALHLRVGIVLACLPRTTVRGFAGCGRSRRRDLHIVPSMADRIVNSLTTSLTFTRNHSPVIRSRIAHHVSAVLLEVPVAMARAWAGVDANARDQSRHEIAERITQRLWDRYTVVPVVRFREIIVPAGNVWCGLKEARNK